MEPEQILQPLVLSADAEGEEGCAMPEISVVMPVYNGEEYLPEAIESILDQTFGNFEFLIVCEHGSSDACLEIVERYAEKDKRVRPIYNSERLGIAASLNVGLEAATGKYIARMDGDDISGPRRFEAQKLFLDAYPDIGVCGTAHTVINSPKWVEDYVADPEQMACDLLFFIPMRHPTIMLRSQLARVCGYDEDLAGGEEYDYFDKLSQVTKLSNVLDQSLFTYRRTGQNASKLYYERDVLIRRETQRRILKRQLGIELAAREMDVLNFVGGAAYVGLETERYADVLQELEALLDRLERRNREQGVYRQEIMAQTLRHRWYRERTKQDRLTKGKIPRSAKERLCEGKYYSPWF